MKMYGCAWKEDGEYSVQVSEVKHGEKTTLTKLFKDWRQTATGWNFKSGEQLFIFRKQFNTEKEWLVWAKAVPFKLEEVKYRAGKEKRIQLTCKTRKKRGQNGTKKEATRRKTS
jgi:hypothetical protein